MLSRLTFLGCLTANSSKFITTMKMQPVSNLLLHTCSAACEDARKGPGVVKGPTRKEDLKRNLGKKHLTDPKVDQKKKDKRVAKIEKEKCSPTNVSLKVAVVLCGFGNLDGSDPYQVMSLAINLGRRGFIPTYYAPNATFCDVVDYITRQAPSKPKPAPPQNSNNTAAQDCNAEAQPTSYLPDKCDAASEKPEPRHFMKESARLTSAPVADLGELEKSVKKFAGLIIPGGRGVIDHLIKNEPGRRAAEMDLIPELGCAIQAFGRERKPIGCIADAGILLAKSFPGSEITFGPAKTNELENDPTQDFALTLEDWRQFLIKYATDFGAHPVYRDMMEVKHFEDERVNCYTTPGSLGIYPTCARVFASVANLVEDMECDLKRAGAPSSSASASS
ncbi:hypothetical protein TKK_0019052 [Trichogramma kaykai]